MHDVMFMSISNPFKHSMGSISCYNSGPGKGVKHTPFSELPPTFSDEHSGKVKSFMLDVLSPLITEADFVSNELLDIILVNIVEPQKTQRKNAFMLAKELIVKTSATLEPYIQGFFNQVSSIMIVNKQGDTAGVGPRLG